MNKTVRIFDYINDMDWDCEKPYIEFSVGLEPKDQVVKEIYDFVDDNKRWSIVDLKIEMPYDFNDIYDIQDALKKMKQEWGKEDPNFTNVNHWTFFEWRELNRYGNYTNRRRLIALRK